MTTEPNLVDQVTSRGLKESFQRIPLRRFKGKLVDYTLDPIPNSQKMRVHLNFADVSVIESTEPYQFPIAIIPITYSDKKNSLWGIFSTSLLQFLMDEEDIKDAKGRFLELVLTPDHHFGRNLEGEEIIMDAWEVASVEGAVSKVNPIEKALELLDGKNESTFNQAVFNEPALKGTDVLSAILNKTFLTTMKGSGQITLDDDGTYHVVKS